MIGFKLKATSPIIATLLLIAITAVASIIVYFWLTGYSTSLQNTNELQKMSMLKLEAVSFLTDEEKRTTYMQLKFTLET